MLLFLSVIHSRPLTQSWREDTNTLTLIHIHLYRHLKVSVLARDRNTQGQSDGLYDGLEYDWAYKLPSMDMYV